jgi:hypothetical protein
MTMMRSSWSVGGGGGGEEEEEEGIAGGAQ